MQHHNSPLKHHFYVQLAHWLPDLLLWCMNMQLWMFEHVFCCISFGQSELYLHLHLREIYAGFAQVTQVTQAFTLGQKRQMKCFCTLSLSSVVRLIFISRFPICLNFFCSFLTSPIWGFVYTRPRVNCTLSCLSESQFVPKCQRANISF